MTIISRFGRLGFVAGLVFLIGISASAQEKTPIPSFTGERVIVADVPDRYRVLSDQISQLEKLSPQSYYVVVVKSTGTGPEATLLYADELVDDWKRQGARRGQSFDPQRSVVIVVALENHQVAVKPGAYLKSELGLDADRVEHDLLKAKGGFLDLAKENRYTDAIANLLTATNNWIAARDRETIYTAVKVAAGKTKESSQPPTTSSTAPATVPKSSSSPPAKRDRSTARTQPAPLKQASSDWLPVILVGNPSSADRACHHRGRLADIPPQPESRRRPHQGDQVEGCRGDGPARCAQGAAQTVACLDRLQAAIGWRK